MPRTTDGDREVLAELARNAAGWLEPGLAALSDEEREGIVAELDAELDALRAAPPQPDPGLPDDVFPW